MEEEPRSHVTERILNLTLEIICLLTGESFPPLKSGDHVTITVPSLHFLKPERPDIEKILEVTKRITESLTGEVPIRCRDVTVYLSMEKWEYLEGHKDLYKDVVMEDEPDGSRKRNPPQRCPRPLEDLRHNQGGDVGVDTVQVKEECKEEDEEYGVMEDFSGGLKDTMVSPERRPRPLEDLPIPRHDQSAELRIVVKEECREEDEEDGSMEELSEEHVNFFRHFMLEPPERCPRPLEDLPIPRHHQGEDLMRVKDEGEEETYVREDQRSTEEAGMMRTSTEEDRPPHVRTVLGWDVGETSEVHLALCSEDEDLPLLCPEDLAPPNHLLTTHTEDSSPKCVLGNVVFNTQRRSDTGKKQPCSCLQCGKSFGRKHNVTAHEESYRDKRHHSCSECGKCFLRKARLREHQTTHTQKPHSCPVCGKRFTRKDGLVQHQISHTGEKPYSCPECGKSFSQKFCLSRHQRYHKGERPFSCSECGKGFVLEQDLSRHQRSHTGEKPYSCSECGKCFARKYLLSTHLKRHRGEIAGNIF